MRSLSRLAIAVGIWSFLVLYPGCGPKTRTVVVEPSNVSSQPPAAAASQPVELQGEPVAAVLMEIDQEVITTSDVLSALADRLQQLARSEPPAQFRPRAEQLVSRYLRQRTAEILLLNEAQSSLDENQTKQVEAQARAYHEQLLRNCEKSPTRLSKMLREKGTTLDAELAKFKRDLQVRVYLSRQFSRRINIARQDIVDYYNRHQQQYSTARKVELLKIQVLSHKRAEPGDSPDQAQVRARQIAQQAWNALAAGESFAAVARKFSDTRCDQGGNWGLVDPLSLQEDSERQAAQTLQVGQYSKVLDTSIGCSIIGLARVIPARQDSLEQVQEQIRRTLWAEQYDRLYNQRINDLSQRAVITVSPAAMRLVVDLAQQRFSPGS
ncbi:MAG: hypothetical protein GWP14_11150 [Actinobacteria bacterium]|nr:hypothetical protein [Actinomycetota bacterium]